MLHKLILALIVGVVVTLAAILIGDILTSFHVEWTTKVGDFLGKYSGVLGFLAALWSYFNGVRRV